MYTVPSHDPYARQPYPYPQFDPTQRLSAEVAPAPTSAQPVLPNPDSQIHVNSRQQIQSHPVYSSHGPGAATWDASGQRQINGPDVAARIQTSQPGTMPDRDQEPHHRSSIVETPIDMRRPEWPRIQKRTPSEPTIPQSASPPLDNMVNSDRSSSPITMTPSSATPLVMPVTMPQTRHYSQTAQYPQTAQQQAAVPYIQAPRRESTTRAATSNGSSDQAADVKPKPQDMNNMSMANIPNHVEPRTNVKPDPTEEPPRQHTYDPLSLYGPNGAAPEAHKPGQISHPNMQSDDGDWRHGLCECGDFGTCCLGCWCPCMLYGKTQYRLNQKSARKDPTNLLSYKACNDSCIVMGVACGFEWFLALLQRSRVRNKYNINGSMGKDCVLAVCCLPCVLTQAEREVRHREEEARKFAGPASGAVGGDAYAPPPTMLYSPT